MSKKPRKTEPIDREWGLFDALAPTTDDPTNPNTDTNPNAPPSPSSAVNGDDGDDDDDAGDAQTDTDTDRRDESVAEAAFLRAKPLFGPGVAPLPPPSTRRTATATAAPSPSPPPSAGTARLSASVRPPIGQTRAAPAGRLGKPSAGVGFQPAPVRPTPSGIGPYVANKPLTVTELTRQIARKLEPEFETILVTGELSNVVVSRPGHVYFDLKDAGSKISCVMWQSTARRVNFKLTNGHDMLIRGKLSVYESRGNYQLYIDHIEPRGKGALQLQFEQLCKKLEAEGLFEPTRKRPIPKLPRRIGVVTSPVGQAIGDILNTITQRMPGVPVLIVPVNVQGDTAADNIVAGVRAVNRAVKAGIPIDVLIVARGGGSSEELSAFNQETVARAIASAVVPVVTGIGHNYDRTVADLVADLHAVTPTAAAQAVVPVRRELLDRLVDMHRRLQDALRRRVTASTTALETAAARFDRVAPIRRIRDGRLRLDDLAMRLDIAVDRHIEHARRQLDAHSRTLSTLNPRERLRASSLRLAELSARLDRAMTAHVADRREDLTALATDLPRTMEAILHERKAQLSALAGQLSALSPLRVFERGYSVTLDANGRAVTDATTLSADEEIQTRLHRGTIVSRVLRTAPSPTIPPDEVDDDAPHGTA